MNQTSCIAIDAMGGDFGPRVTVEAALAALERHPKLTVLLFGDQNRVAPYLPSVLPDRFTFCHAPESISAEMRVQQALRLSEGSSMQHAITAVRDQRAQALVSAGNTAVLMAFARRSLGMLAGIDRPAITAAVPTLEGQCQVLDLGANIDCSAEMLFQFALLGSALLMAEFEMMRPRVGLLNIGAEQSKGTETLREASQLIAQLPGIDYLGFVEGDDLFAGRADLVVCDGLTGNVALKSSEGLASLIRQKVRRSFTRSWYRYLLAYLAKPVLNELQSELDSGARNGAILLGLKGLVIKSHGSADARDFGFAIDHAVKSVEQSVLEGIEKAIHPRLNVDYKDQLSPDNPAPNGS